MEIVKPTRSQAWEARWLTKSDTAASRESRGDRLGEQLMLAQDGPQLSKENFWKCWGMSQSLPWVCLQGQHSFECLSSSLRFKCRLISL